MLKYIFIILLPAQVFAQNLPDISCIKDITPVITISNVDPLICEGELTHFTADAYYGDALPSYQWLVNGKPVGFNKPEYNTDSLTNGSLVECILTISKPSCTGTKSATSQMTIYVYPMIHPKITITPSQNPICRGQEVTFSATANGGDAETFVWEINGKPTGEIGSTFSSNSLKDNDSVSCTVTIDQNTRCHTGWTANSNKVVMHVKDYVDPTITIAAPQLNACAGTPLSFTATVQNNGDFSIYNWYANGNYIGSSFPVFTYDQFKNGDKVSCIISTNITGCFLPVEASSNIEVLTITEAPVITFLPPDISIFSGESAQINTSVSGANLASFLWKPAGALLTPQALIPTTIPLINDTSYNLSVVDINGCTSSKDIVVKVLHKVYMPSAFTPNQDGLNDVFRIPPGSSLDLESFEIFDRFGKKIFSTTDISKGWDGKYHNQSLNTGTFVYIIKGTVKDKPVFMKGIVNLLK